MKPMLSNLVYPNVSKAGGLRNWGLFVFFSKKKAKDGKQQDQSDPQIELIMHLSLLYGFAAQSRLFRDGPDVTIGFNPRHMRCDILTGRYCTVPATECQIME